MCLLRLLWFLPHVQHSALCDTVRQTSLAIHQYFRSGHLEKVYENTLAHRLRNKAIDVKQQMPIDIYDEDGTLVGHYTADLLIESQLIVELKACHTLTTEHFAQVFGYLRGSRLRHVMLINFGSQKIRSEN